jgi:hypothetical protein
MAAETVEARVAKIEGSFEQMDRRMGSLEARLIRLEGKIDLLIFGVFFTILLQVSIRLFFP